MSDFKTELKVGDTIIAGTLLLLTSGSYSDFGVNGIYRAKKDFVVPSKLPGTYYRPKEPVADIYAISKDPTLVEELSYTEIWMDM